VATPGPDAVSTTQAAIAASFSACSAVHDQFDVDAGRLLHKQLDIDQEVFGFSGAGFQSVSGPLTEEPLKETDQQQKKSTGRRLPLAPNHASNMQ